MNETPAERLKRIRENLASLKAQGAPREVVDKYLASERTTPQAEAAQMPTSAIGKLAQAGATLGQGATFGLLDEIVGGARAALTGQPYDEAVGTIRESLGEFREENPMTAFGLEAAGAVAVPFSAGARIPSLAGAGVLKSAGRGAIDAGLSGALSGAANAEGSVADRLKAAAATGGISSILGGALGAAIPVAGKAARRTANEVVGVKPASAGREMLVDVVEETPEAVTNAQRILDEMVAAGRGDEAMAADVLGKQGARLVRGARTRSAAADELLDDVLGGRNARAGERIAKTFADETGATGEGAATVRDQLVRERAEAAAPLYDEARKLGDIAPLMQQGPAAAAEGMGLYDVMQSAPVRQLIERTRAMPQFRNLPETDMRVMDYVYKQLGRKASSATDGAERFELGQIRNAMRDELTRVNPAYGEALETFADASDVIEAFNTGTAFLSGKSDELTAAVKNLSPTEQDAVKRGAAEALLTRIRDISTNADLPQARTQDIAQALFGKEGLATRYREVFGKESYDRILPAIREEMRMFGTSNVIRGGSNTADKAFDAVGLTDFSGGLQSPSALLGLLGKVNRMVPDRGAEDLARRMTTKGEANVRSELENLLREIQSREAARLSGQTAGQRAARAIGGTVGGAARQ